MAFIINQGFEGTGYDNSESWSGTGNPDYTGIVLAGSQSLQCESEENAYTDFSGVTEHWGHILFQKNQNPSETCMLIYLKTNGGATAVGSIRLLSTGYLAIRHGTTEVYAETTALSNATTYHIWWRWKNGSGSNGEFDVWLSTSATRPGTREAYLTNGNSTDTPGRLYCISSIGGATFVFDTVQVANSDDFTGGGASPVPSSTLARGIAVGMFKGMGIGSGQYP